jgi:succinate dehydrogenase/fumarate reductase flavoprotein subunit
MLGICPVISLGSPGAQKRSRFGHGHKRSDYPEMREEYHGSIILKKSGDGFSMRFEPAEKY